MLGHVYCRLAPKHRKTRYQNGFFSILISPDSRSVPQRDWIGFDAYRCGLCEFYFQVGACKTCRSYTNSGIGRRSMKTPMQVLPADRCNEGRHRYVIVSVRLLPEITSRAHSLRLHLALIRYFLLSSTDPVCGVVWQIMSCDLILSAVCVNIGNVSRVY